MINLTRGVPPVEVFPIEELIKASEKNLREDGKRVLQYLHAPGYPPLIEYLAKKHGVRKEEVVLGNSSLELLQFVTLTEMKPGDCAYIESPSYDRANTLLKRSGADVVGIPLEIDGVNLDILEKELKKRPPKLFYIISDFQNPMGTTTCAEKRKQIAKWAEEYDFLVVEDAPYRELRYHGTAFPSIRSFAPDHVVTLSSFSKTLAPGLRTGYLYGREDIVKRITAWEVDTYIGSVTPTQGQVYEYLNQGFFEPNLNKLCDLYRPRLDTLLNSLDKYLPNAVYPRPEGGFFVGVTLPEGNSMEKLLPAAADAGFKLTDGRGFYLNPQDGDRFLRIPFCSLSPEEISNAIQSLAKIIVH